MTGIEQQQIDYYRARAGEYDEWFLRRGRYDQGPENNGSWFTEAEVLRERLAELGPLGRVLELAAGTGIWTERLIRQAEGVHCIDAAPETAAVNRARNPSPSITHEVADLFDWRPRDRYDTVFFGFWLSHVPEHRFEPFWETVAGALAPGGRVFFIDSRPDQTSTAPEHLVDDSGYQVRRLNDGRSFRIVKRYYEPDVLQGRLRRLGWAVEVGSTPRYFLWGTGGRA
ncbi:MAG TPA: class I SAM-dependent methyltransferase [Candidatus Dormibacteraeota bacterium]|jgi:demethylmenaquinone methyltransferase/2-methoxy-6-polyprenyl-1,4-benzoquinol methylase|nr:class I SAM-dependent methyltransferase [Candidatus Dormibacteraeota bacterium]